jgi:predicted regulator of Ras-like GTPase activity (Roadblock/LC7/MglB family)
MNQTRQACGDVLRSLSSRDGVLGSCLISRDGLPVLSEWANAADLDTIAAMGAALMGAAETSLLEFGERELETVLIVSQNMRLVIIGVDEELLLLAAMDRTLPIDAFDAQLMESLTRLSMILEEA